MERTNGHMPSPVAHGLGRRRGSGLAMLLLALALAPVLTQAFPVEYRMPLPIETPTTHTGAEALARVTAVLTRLGGQKVQVLALDWHTDFYLMAEELHAGASQQLEEDTELSLVCFDYAHGAPDGRAIALCLEIAAMYLGPDS